MPALTDRRARLASARPSTASRALALAAVIALLLTALPLDRASAQSRSVGLIVSASPDRREAVSLAGRTLWGSVYVTAVVPAQTARVHFHLDDPDLRKLPTHTEHQAPHDLMGGSETRANPWDTSRVPAGAHLLTAVAVMRDGTRLTSASTTFTIEHPATSAGDPTAADDTGGPTADGGTPDVAPGVARPGASTSGSAVAQPPAAQPPAAQPPAPQPPAPQPPAVQPPPAPEPAPQPQVPQPAGVHAFPSAATTGPRPGITLTRVDGGVVREDGAVLQGLHIDGCLLVDADHVVIRDVVVTCRDGHGISFADGTTGGRIEHSRLLGSGTGADSGVRGGWGITVARTDISGFEDGMKGAPASRYEANYVHDLATGTRGHNDGLQLMAGTDVQIIGNTFDLVVAQDVNAGVWIKQDMGRIAGVLIQGNLFSGAGYHVKVGNGHDVVAVDNVHTDVFRWGVYDGDVVVRGARTTDGRPLGE